MISNTIQAVAHHMSECLPAESHDHIVDEFLRGRTQTTLKAYRADMEAFAAWLNVADTNEAARLFLSYGAAHANRGTLDYRNHMKESGLQHSTINRRLSTLRSLTKLARMRGLINWSLEVENLRNRAYRDTKGPRESGFRRLQTQAEQRTDAKGMRDHSILLLLHDLGLRRGEVCSLDMVDVDIANSTIWILGKGDSQKQGLMLPGRTLEALRRWIDSRGNHAGPLFTNLHRSEAIAGSRLTTTSLYRIIQRLGQDTNQNVTPHKIRHTAITTAVERASEAGISDMSKVLSFSRHKSLKTLQIYVDSHENFQGRLAAVVAR